jgi:hypothetical protein
MSININIRDENINVRVTENPVRINLLNGAKGPKGDQGNIEFTAENIDDRTFLIGEVMSVNNSNKAILASAGSTNYGLGIATIGASIGFSETIRTVSYLELVDWTNIVGTQYLSPRQDYYLSTVKGKMVLVPDGTTGDYVQKIGTALTTTKLSIEIGYSILL